jgi:hypothetical protein
MALTTYLSRAAARQGSYQVMPAPEALDYLAKARRGGGGASAEDMLRPDPQHRLGFTETPNYFVQADWQGMNERLLWDTYRYDPVVFGMVEKIKRKAGVCEWSLREKEPGKGDPAHRERLEAFYHMPDGETSYFMLHCVIVARLKVIGHAHARLIRASIVNQVGSPAHSLMSSDFYVSLAKEHPQIAECVRKICEEQENFVPKVTELLLSVVKDLFPRSNVRELEKGLREAMDKPFEAFKPITNWDAPELRGAGYFELLKAAKATSPDDILGFEVLEGQVRKNADVFGRIRDAERAYIQIAGAGMRRQFFPDRDIIEYRHKSPAGGIDGLSEVRVIEKWSDASLWSALQQRDFLRTMGRADVFLLLKGFNEIERKKVWAEMLRRADVAAADQAGLPIVSRTDAGNEHADVKAVNIGGLPRDMLYKDYEDLMFTWRMATLHVPSGPMGRTERVNRCYSADTEVLTENGWKRYGDVADGERIAVYDMRTGAMRFELPLARHEYDYVGDMVRVENQCVDFLVTPNHKLLVGERAFAPERENPNDYCVRWKSVTASEVVGKDGSMFWVKASPEIWEGQEINEVTIPAVEQTNQAKSSLADEVKLEGDLFMEFLGYYLSEGGMCNRGYDGYRRYFITFAQKDASKADVMRRCFAKLPFPVRENWDEADKLARWYVGGKNLCLFLERECGSSVRGKRIPRWVKNASRRQLSILLDALMLGDGETAVWQAKGAWGNNEPRQTGKYASSCKELIDDVQEVALRLGYRAFYRPEGYLKEGYERPVYFLNVHRRNEVMVRSNCKTGRRPVSVEPYDGKVWCFTTSTGFFVTRRNGKVAIQGNSNMDAQREELADEVNWQNRIIKETNTEQIHVRSFGFTDWVFEIAKYEPRNREMVMRQTQYELERGLITVGQAAARLGEDRWTVEGMPEDVRETRLVLSGGQLLDWNTWKLQQQIQQAQLMMQAAQMQQQLEAPPEQPQAAAPAVTPPAEEPPAEVSPSEMEAEGGEETPQDEETQAARPMTLRKASPRDVLRATLRALQKWENEAAGRAGETVADVAELSDVPRPYRLMASEGLKRSRTPSDVHDVFRAVKSRVRQDYENGVLGADSKAAFESAGGRFDAAWRGGGADGDFASELWKPIGDMLAELEAEVRGDGN